MKKIVSRLSCSLLVLLILAATVGCGTQESSFTDEQLRKLAFGAVLSTRNSMDFISMLGLTTYDVDSVKELLDDSWSITDHDTAIERLDALRDEGHRISSSSLIYGFDDIYLVISGKVEPYEGELDKLYAELDGYEDICRVLISDYGYTQQELDSIETVSAWDYDRLVTVARWCAGVEYISVDEAWEYIDAAAAAGKADYDSWRTYFAGVVIGRAIWSEEGVFANADQSIAKQLLLDEKSIYNTTTF